MPNYIEKLEELLHNKSLHQLIARMKDGQYDKLSVIEKIKCYEKFNELVDKYFGTYIDIKINKEVNEIANKGIYFSDSEYRIIINGFDEGPYLTFQKILLTHLFCLQKENNTTTVTIDDIEFDPDRYFYEPFYHFDSKRSGVIKDTNYFFDELLKDVNDDYKKEYQEGIYRSLSLLGFGELANVNKLAHAQTEKDTYIPLKRIEKRINSLVGQEEIKERDLALFSVTAILKDLATKMEKDELQVNLRKFLMTYFDEYADYIKVHVASDGQIRLNNRPFNLNEEFIDYLMRVIAEVENNAKISDLVVSDEIYQKIKNRHPSFTKFDAYLYSRLANLDGNLRNRNLDLVNYFGFTNIFYKNSKAKKLFEDKKPIFANLTKNKEFLTLIANYLNSEGNGKEELYAVFDALNKSYYNANYKLVLCEDGNGEDLFGVSDQDSIYLNLEANANKSTMLSTLFHEYRHLVQTSEIKNSHGIYRPEMLKIVTTNAYITPFREDYNYISNYEYINPWWGFYQPLEYDAESFSKKMLLAIKDNLPKEDAKKVQIINNSYNLLRNVRYIDMGALSLLSYNAYLKRMRVLEDNESEREQYKQITEMIGRCKTVSDARKLFATTNIHLMELKEKVEVYKKLADYVDVEFDLDHKIVTIAGKEYDYTDMASYDIMEKIFLAKAMYKIRKHELETLMLKEFILDEAEKVKPVEYNAQNAILAYSYHQVFDKYGDTLERKMKRKIKSKYKK